MGNGFLRVFFLEWKKFFRSPRLIVWVFAVPLMMFFFYGALFKSGVPRDLPINIVDYDNSVLSRKLIRFIDASPIMAVSEVKASEKEAKTELERSDVYASMIIPSRFQRDIYQGKGPQVVCYVNGQFILPAGLIQSAFLSTAGTFSAGIKLDIYQKTGQTYSQAVNSISNVKVDKHILYNPYMNYSYYLNLAMIPMMLQILIMVVSVYVLGLVMKKRKTAKLLSLGKGNPWSVLCGKLLPYTILFFVIDVFMNLFLFDFIGTPLNSSMGEVILITFFMIIAYQGMAVFFVSFSKDLRSAMTYGGGFSALAFSFSGYTFPVEGIPTSMKVLGQVFPYTHFMKAFVNSAIKGLPLSFSIVQIGALCVFVLIGVFSVTKFSVLLKNNGYEPEQKI